MVVLGLGTDLAEVGRIEQSIARFGKTLPGTRFYRRVRLRTACGKRAPARALRRGLRRKRRERKALGTGISHGRELARV